MYNQRGQLSPKGVFWRTFKATGGNYQAAMAASAPVYQAKQAQRAQQRAQQGGAMVPYQGQPQGYAPQGYAPQGYAPQGYAPQGNGGYRRRGGGGGGYQGGGGVPASW